jgi:hypothetical protein
MPFHVSWFYGSCSWWFERSGAKTERSQFSYPLRPRWAPQVPVSVIGTSQRKTWPYLLLSLAPFPDLLRLAQCYATVVKLVLGPTRASSPCRRLLDSTQVRQRGSRV